MPTRRSARTRPGTFVASDEAEEATPCAAGSYQPASGSTSCLPAPAGSHVPVAGSAAAALCDRGTFSASSGATACTPAAVGYYVPRPGATQQLRCLTATEPGLSVCPAPTTAPVETPEAEEDAPETGDEPLSAQGDACPPGSWSATGTSRAGSSCTPASPGTFVAEAGATAEEPCPAGSYSDTFGATECTPAPVGSYVATTGAMDPVPCPGATEPGLTVCPEAAAAPLPVTTDVSTDGTPVWWWVAGLALVLAAGGAGFVLVQRRTGALVADVGPSAGRSTLTRLRGIDTTDVGGVPVAPPSAGATGVPEVLEWDEALDGRPAPEDEEPPPDPRG